MVNGLTVWGQGAGHLESLGSASELLRKTITTGHLSSFLGISKYFIIKREQHKHLTAYIPQSAQILLPLGLNPGLKISSLSL